MRGVEFGSIIGETLQTSKDTSLHALADTSIRDRASRQETYVSQIRVLHIVTARDCTAMIGMCLKSQTYLCSPGLMLQTAIPN